MAPNSLLPVEVLASHAARPKRVRRVKKATTDSSRAAATASEAAGAEGDAPQRAVEGEPALSASPRSYKQQKTRDSGAALLQRIAGMQVQSVREVSPPLGKVQERHGVWQENAKASMERGPSTLGMCVIQADGTSGAREVDWLSHSVASFSLR